MIPDNFICKFKSNQEKIISNDKKFVEDTQVDSFIHSFIHSFIQEREREREREREKKRNIPKRKETLRVAIQPTMNILNTVKTCKR